MKGALRSAIEDKNALKPSKMILGNWENLKK
jgi:hypothetical protein